ncbi:hypothetical protein [Agromyces aureus]|nr:hypothetical protein [Agromyces aureus]
MRKSTTKSTRIALSIAATGVAMMASLIAAPAANAATGATWSTSYVGKAACDQAQARAIATKRAQGYQISRLKVCVPTGPSYWSGSFYYSKGGPIPV